MANGIEQSNGWSLPLVYLKGIESVGIDLKATVIVVALFNRLSKFMAEKGMLPGSCCKADSAIWQTGERREVLRCSPIDHLSSRLGSSPDGCGG